MERMLTMDNKKFYELGLYEKSMPNTLSFREKLEIVKATGFDFWKSVSMKLMKN